MLSISGTGAMTDYDQYAEPSIAAPWYALSDSITGLSLPEGLTSIGDWAFCDCELITSVTIPQGVTSIGRNAFYSCEGLVSVTIPNSVETIGVQAFQECYALADISIPDGVVTIGTSAFQYCESITSLTIPDSVISLGEAAFLGCSGLTTITIPGSVSEIEGWMFQDCTGLTTVIIGEGITSVGQAAFTACANISSVTIPASVTNIGSSAFSDCPASLTVIYGGTEAQKTVIMIGEHNDPLLNATWYCLPTITAQPTDITVNEGQTATFEVAAVGATSCQWEYQKPGESAWNKVTRNGTSETYSVTTEARHNGYAYRCKVTNTAGEITSDPVKLTVNPKPVITTQPKASTVYVGKTATFKVEATGATGYQWQYQKPDTTTWVDVSRNGTSATYSLTTETRHNGYTYRCKVSNAAGSVYSSAVKLTVSEKPVITTQPKAASVAAGEKATFKVEADGATSYQWQYQKPGESTWNNVKTNGTSATYSLVTEARHNGYTYRCKVTNAKGSVFSSSVKLTVK